MSYHYNPLCTGENKINIFKSFLFYFIFLIKNQIKIFVTWKNKKHDETFINFLSYIFHDIFLKQFPIEPEYSITDIVDTISFPSFFLSPESFYSKRTVFFWYFPNWKIKLSHIFHVSKLIHITHEVFPNTLIFPKFYCKIVSQTFISLKKLPSFYSSKT